MLLEALGSSRTISVETEAVAENTSVSDTQPCSTFVCYSKECFCLRILVFLAWISFRSSLTVGLKHVLLVAPSQAQTLNDVWWSSDGAIFEE